jgi:adenosylcobinamide-GDP ribazoletransferase
LANAEKNIDIVTAWLRDVQTAMVFLTRLPVPVPDTDEPRPLAAVAWSFPVIGLIVGAIAGGVLMAGTTWLDLYPMTCGLLALAAGVLVTGALHEDALADVADGFGGGGDAKSKMEIMRDSRIGAYGVLALIFSVAIRAAALASMAGPGTAALALIVSAVVSRSLMVAALYQMPSARKDGLGASAGKPSIESVAVALAIAAAVAFALLGSVGWMVLATGVALAIAMGWLAQRQIGGHTGDVLGSISQVVEIAILLTVSAMLG